MKKRMLVLMLLSATLLAACSSYVCPTYAKFSPHKKISSGHR